MAQNHTTEVAYALRTAQYLICQSCDKCQVMLGLNHPVTDPTAMPDKVLEGISPIPEDPWYIETLEEVQNRNGSQWQ
jgi:hypothetical protein